MLSVGAFLVLGACAQLGSASLASYPHGPQGPILYEQHPPPPLLNNPLVLQPGHQLVPPLASSQLVISNFDRYDTSHMKISPLQQTGRHCFHHTDCPSQAACYQRRCVCQVGYMYLNSTNQCFRKSCNPFQSECPNYFANSECVTQEASVNPENSGHCVCLYSFAVNSLALTCQDLYQITPYYVWHKVLGHLTLWLFLPIAGVIVVIVTLVWIAIILWRECTRKDTSDDEDESEEFATNTKTKKIRKSHSVSDEDLEGICTMASFELEPMNREPYRKSHQPKGNDGDMKNSTFSLNGRVPTPVPVTTKVGRYFRSTHYGGEASSPV